MTADRSAPSDPVTTDPASSSSAPSDPVPSDPVAADPASSRRAPADLDADQIWHSPLTWLGRGRGLSRWVGRPIVRFARIETAGGFLLLVATLAALVWANSPWDAAYHNLFEFHFTLQLGDDVLIDQTVGEWINDGAMAVFFFVVGMEVKREFVVGDLRKPAAAALPVIGALGGMIVPALIYTAFNAGGPASSGWGIPMATDIAFAIGFVVLLGSRVPSALKLFLLTLAIVDDIGAILVIALFYSDDLSGPWLLVSAAIVVVLALMRYSRIWYTPAYLIVGLVLWYAVFESGVHATIAGVILGLFTPARPLVSDDSTDAAVVLSVTKGSVDVPGVRRAWFHLRERVSVAERLENLLHPWTSFVIVPVFALANAGVTISGDSIADALSSELTMGIVAGLVIGKLVGITLACWAGVRTGLCALPAGVTWPKMVGISAVAGIGFTVSLFIARLEFDAGPLISEAKIGVLFASLAAAVLGVVILVASGRTDRAEIFSAEG